MSGCEPTGRISRAADSGSLALTVTDPLKRGLTGSQRSSGFEAGWSGSLTGRWQVRSAMATSLTAIGIIAFAGTISYALRGEVKPGAAALIGIPAAFGAIGGTALQQRVNTRTLSLLFALVLAVIGVKLLV